MDGPGNTSITKYQLRYGAGATVPATATWGDISDSDATTTSHTVTGLTNGFSYAFQIRAVNAGGESDTSERCGRCRRSTMCPPPQQPAVWVRAPKTETSMLNGAGVRQFEL